MTLARRLSLTTIATTISMAAIAIAAMIGLNGMSRDITSATDGLDQMGRDINIAMEEYEKLRRVYDIGLHAVRARTLLDSFGEPSVIVQELERTRSKLAVYLEDTGGADDDAVLTVLKDLQTSVAAGVREEYVQLVDQQFNQVITRIAELAKDTSNDIKAAQKSANAASIRIAQARQSADERRRTTIAIVASLAAGIILIAVAVNIWQYASVINPLKRLRRGVTKIAAGEFTDRVDATGDREFADLAGDFNQMAEHLDTLYRSLEDKVREKSRELVRSERLASVGFLAAGVAHEINNPLGIMSGYAELSLRKIDKARQSKADISDELEKSLNIICEEAFRCKSIIEKLLTLTRGGGDEVRSDVDVGQVAADVAEMVKGLPYYRQRTLDLNVAGNQNGALVIHGNETEIKQVLLNLTVNALEAVPPGDGHVDVKVQPQGDNVVITVRDNGKGMSPQTLEHVFEPFYTEKRGTSGDGSRHGTGLGLAITHAIVEQHEGRITAASAGINKGSLFTIVLPREVA